MAGPASVGLSTPPWMYAPRPSAPPAPTVAAPQPESALHQALGLGSKGASFSESIIQEGSAAITRQLGSQWQSVDEMSGLLRQADEFAAWARGASIAGHVLTAGEILTANDPVRAGIKEGFTYAGTAIAAPLGPIGATVSGELIGGTYDKLFFEDVPTLRAAGAGLVEEGGVLADITREGLHGPWASRMAHIDDIATTIDAVGEGQGFVRENLADALSVGYRGVATLGAGVDYAGETVAQWGSDAAHWLYTDSPTGGQALGGILEFGPDDWHGCGGPSTGWIVPDRYNMPALGIDIDATPACQGHDDAWVPGASLNEMTRADVRLGLDIINGGDPDQSLAETAARSVIGFGYTFATDASALGSAAWEGVSSLWDSFAGDSSAASLGAPAVDDYAYDAVGWSSLENSDDLGYEQF